MTTLLAHTSESSQVIRRNKICISISERDNSNADAGDTTISHGGGTRYDQTTCDERECQRIEHAENRRSKAMVWISEEKTHDGVGSPLQVSLLLHGFFWLPPLHNPGPVLLPRACHASCRLVDDNAYQLRGRGDREDSSHEEEDGKEEEVVL